MATVEVLGEAGAVARAGAEAPVGCRPPVPIGGAGAVLSDGNREDAGWEAGAPGLAVAWTGAAAEVPLMADSPRLTIWTIGHSNHPMATMVDLLRGGAIEVVADLRTTPHSRFNPQFGRRSFERALAADGIGYAWMGDVLGGRPSEPELRDAEGSVDYVAVSRTDRFRFGIDRLLDLSSTALVAMLCSEADPVACHRRRLVTPALVERGVDVIHLLGDGGAISEADLAARLDGRTPPTLF